MTISDPKNAAAAAAAAKTAQDVEELEQSSMQGGAELDRSYKDEPSSSIQFDIYELGCKFLVLYSY